MYDKDKIKVALGENHTPSAATIAVAESLKNDGNALLAGDVCRSLAGLGGDRVPDVVGVGGGGVNVFSSAYRCTTALKWRISATDADLPFTDGKVLQAVEKYSESIKLYPTPKCFGNRALAYLKLESYGLAITDSEEALQLDPNYIKVAAVLSVFFFRVLPTPLTLW